MVLVWQITDNSANLPNILPTKLSRYTVNYKGEQTYFGHLISSLWHITKLMLL